MRLTVRQLNRTLQRRKHPLERVDLTPRGSQQSTRTSTSGSRTRTHSSGWDRTLSQREQAELDGAIAGAENFLNSR